MELYPYTLTLLHSEKAKTLDSFGPSECNWVNLVDHRNTYSAGL